MGDKLTEHERNAVNYLKHAIALLADMGEAELLGAERVTSDKLAAAYAAGDAEEAAGIATARGWILDALEDVMGDRFAAWLEGLAS